MKSLVSIITPSYNSEKYIAQAVNSVINQTYVNWELIIVDDASTDNTVAIINTFIKVDSRIKLHQFTTNKGAAAARNKGTDIANGDFIAFLDADDVWLNHKLEIQLTFMKSQNCDVCFSSYNIIDSNSDYTGKMVNALAEVSYDKLLKSNYIGNLTGIYNANILGKIKAPNLRKRQDWALWLKAVKKASKSARGVLEPLAQYRIHNQNMSSNKISLLKHNFLVYRKGLGFSVVKSWYYMMLFLFEHFFVKSKLIVFTGKK